MTTVAWAPPVGKTLERHMALISLFIFSVISPVSFGTCNILRDLLLCHSDSLFSVILFLFWQGKPNSGKSQFFLPSDTTQIYGGLDNTRFMPGLLAKRVQAETNPTRIHDVLLAYWQCTCACTKNYKHTYIICTSYTVNILCGSTAVGPDTRFSMCTLVLEIRVLSRKVKCRNEYKYLYYFLKKRLYCSKAEDIF